MNKDEVKVKRIPKGVLRDAHGHLLKGTKGISPGRPVGTSFMDDFRVAMKITERKKRMTLLEHFCRRAYKDDRVLIAIMKKLLPDLKIVEVLAMIDKYGMGKPSPRVQKMLEERVQREGMEEAVETKRRTHFSVPVGQSIIYAALTTSNLVKIGKTKNFYNRAGTLFSANSLIFEIFPLLRVRDDNALQKEQELHKRYLEYRIRGEWFRLEGRLQTYIRNRRRLCTPLRIISNE